MASLPGMTTFKKLQVKLTKSVPSCTEICGTATVIKVWLDLSLNMCHLYGTLTLQLASTKLKPFREQQLEFCLDEFLTKLDLSTLQQR